MSAKKKAQSVGGSKGNLVEKGKEQWEAEIQRLTSELNKEREERNYFQLERDKIESFWAITKNELSKYKSELLNKDREIEEQEEKHQVEIKVYKQKVKHLLYEYQNNIAHLQADSENAISLKQEEHRAQEAQLKKDKRGLKIELKEFELSHQDIIKNLIQKHDQEITKLRSDFERRARELHSKYEKRMKGVREDLDLKRKNEIHEIEERKNSQINALMKNHDKAFTEIKNYYNDITLNNLALINSLKEQVEEMKKKEERSEKAMIDITAENKRLSEPLQLALSECDSLKRELTHYKKDKASLQNTKARLKVLEEKHKELLWEHEISEQRFQQVERERDELYEKFVDRVIGVQQKTGFKNSILEKKVELLKESLEKKEIQISEVLKATNLDPSAISSLTRRLEEVLNVKNQQIKELQYDLSKVTKAHNDMIRVYEAKLTEFSIPVEELGFKPLYISSKNVQAPKNPSGFVAAPNFGKEFKRIFMSRKDQDSFIEPSFVPRSVNPQKFDTPDEYLNFLKENELTSHKSIANTTKTVKNSQLSEKLNDLITFKTRTIFSSDVSRTVYLWDFDGKSLDSVSNIPKIITRSKVFISDYSHKTHVDHSIAIQLITKSNKSQKPSKVIQKQQKQVAALEDEEDIFADAGRDYVLEVDESYQSQAESFKVNEDDLGLGGHEIYDPEPILVKETVDIANMVDTDMIDLDLDEIEYSNYQESSQPKKKLKLRSEFDSEEAWKSYEETQSLMFSGSRIPMEESKTRRGRGSHRGGARGSQRGSHRGSHKSGTKDKGKLDRELEAVDKVYQKKYGTGLK